MNVEFLREFAISEAEKIAVESVIEGFKKAKEGGTHLYNLFRVLERLYQIEDVDTVAFNEDNTEFELEDKIKIAEEFNDRLGDCDDYNETYHVILQQVIDEFKAEKAKEEKG